MKEDLINIIARDLANYLRMSCSSDWTDEDIVRFLKMEYNFLSKIDEIRNREKQLTNCLSELYSIASNGMISDDLICMVEAEKLLYNNANF